jgi:translation initiation factor IF-3
VNRIFANDEIYGYSVVLIDENGSNKGEVNKRSAITQAKSIGLDLVQVGKSPNGIPICKFADAGKIKYEASKKKTTVKQTETKEMMFHLKTGENDIQIKKNKIRGMLEKKCIVKFGIELKGRERAFMDNAKQILTSAVSDFSGIAKWDDIKVLDNRVFVILRPNRETHHEEKTPS